MKRQILCVFLALILLLSACSAQAPTVPQPSDEPETEAPQPMPDAPEPVKEEPPEEPPEPEPPAEKEKTVLPDGLFIFQDMRRTEIASSGYQAAIFNGKLICRGSLSYVTNLATGEVVGFTASRYTDRPIAGEDRHYFSWTDVPIAYELYHPDGTFWCDCGNFRVSSVLGDYFFGQEIDSDDNNWWQYHYFTKTPADASSRRLAPELYSLGNGLCLIENNNQSAFLGITGFAVVNEALDILVTHEIPKAEYDIFSVGGDYYLEVEGEDRLLDPSTMGKTPYVSVSYVMNGYYNSSAFCLLKDSGTYDLIDLSGKKILTGCEHEIKVYNGTFVYFDDGEIYRISDGELGESMMVPSDCELFLNGRYVYLLDQEEKLVKCYDSRLKLCATFTAESMYIEYGSLCFRNEDGLWALFKGGPRAIKVEWESDLYDLERNASTDVESRYVLYNQSEDYLLSFLNEEGETVSSGYDQITTTGYPHIYAAMKGDRWGLIDEDANWLFTQYVVED